ncbi:efflux RND transporter periplasmic adaptor subunit [Simiduia curdlanivorans]|uniref:Efflux RND transporter periplasmic adaptor subunit n=1 Tax=Simiduia curdlanivorans TaxID=1492769 RepID=A0ABV8V6V6_9GAMM|nr:efflux RND transporter periplasmic adaptor subunit [Simiduia curdlanivorans]MDN3638581.1 efflux RND transporter periplasmic adaptor subunit [Simiduia curdlanivorans]
MNRVQEIWSHKNYRMAIIFSLVVLVWMASGLLGSEPEQPSLSAAPEVTVPSVQAQIIHAQQYSPSLVIRARTEPNRAVHLKAEVSGRVEALPIKEGAPVKQGDVICQLAEEDRALKVQEAEVNLRKAQIDFDGSQRLKVQGYQSQSAIAAAEAQLAQARSLLKRQELELAYTKIRAPFDGILNSRQVEIGTFMQRGDICASVIDLDPLVVAGQVSENEIAGLRVGSLTQVQLADVSRDGEIRYISRDALEHTRSFLVEASVANPGMKIPGGLTTTLTAQLASFNAQSLSPALLTLDDAGKLGVRIIDEQSRVQFVNVHIVGDSAEGVWVTGLPETVLLITVGQEYVAVGEQVTYQLVAAEASSVVAAGAAE